MSVGKLLAMSVTALLCVAGATQAGTIGTVTPVIVVPPLFADFDGGTNTFTSSAFNFTGITNGGTFALSGTYDTGLGTVLGTFNATGLQNVTFTPVSFAGTVSKMDLGSYSGSGVLRFLIDQPASPLDVYVLVDARNGVANAYAVPAPAAAFGGASLIGLMAVGSLRRRTNA
jgi:hypothetical protein